MDKDQALIALSALSQETRLTAFKILLEYGRTGIAAGVLSERLDVPHNTLSFHLAHLSHAGLVLSRKQGRSVIYSANCDAMDGLLGFLVENCCSKEEGTPDCAADCSPKKKAKRRKV